LNRRVTALLLLLQGVAVGVLAGNAGAAGLPAVPPAPLTPCTPESFSDEALAQAPLAQTQVNSVGVGGGKVYTYKVGETTFSIPHPPSGFKPTSASNKTLEEYGYPPRPSDPAALPVWEKMMGGYKSSAPPTACLGPTPPVAGQGPVYHGKTSPNVNWSGFETAAGGNPSQWVGVTGRFTQTNGTARESCKSNAIISSWTGLGGDAEIGGNGALLQSGTDAYASGGYAAWEEWISSRGVANGVYVPLTVRPGDVIEEGTVYGTAYNHPPGSVYFYNTNLTTGEQFVGSVFNLGSSYYDGATTDFIDERPSGNSGYYPLLNFGSIPWTWAIALNSAGAWAELGVTNHIRDVMVNGGGTLLAEPSFLETGHSFTDHYYHCQ
jgi:hypothetical protein